MGRPRKPRAEIEVTIQVEQSRARGKRGTEKTQVWSHVAPVKKAPAGKTTAAPNVDLSARPFSLDKAWHPPTPPGHTSFSWRGTQESETSPAHPPTLHKVSAKVTGAGTAVVSPAASPSKRRRSPDKAWKPAIPPGHTAFSWAGSSNKQDRAWNPRTPPGHTNFSWGAKHLIADESPMFSYTLAAPDPLLEPLPGFDLKATSNSKKKNKKSPAKKSSPRRKRASDIPDIARFTFKCGKVMSVKDHPDADGCYIEEIDLGEDKPRTVVSGLRDFMTKEELQDAFVVVVANLKPVPMRGVVSHGMVTVAADEGSEELLTPPPGAKPGDRCVPESFEKYPEATTLMDIKKKKSKLWRRLKENMMTNDSCEACYDGNRFVVPGKGPVTVKSLSNRFIY